MCGIAGLVAVDASLERASALVAEMTARIAHRGPDGGGIVAHLDATLGMKRLAIVDIENGRQPMANEDESVVIVFNGEIYNAPALRAELEQKGVHFRTRSDTEVILRRYEQDPESVEDALAGMWAFAIHDRKRRRVLLSRDRFGIKPLFIADTGRALAFASELRCFDRDFSPFRGSFDLDYGAAHAMLSWSYVPAARTMFRGVRRLPPATRLEVDLASGRRTERTFWRIVPNPDAGRIPFVEDACREVERLLRRSVREHLESDVPIATFLSGGIDSSLVTALAAEESARPIKAFAIGFEDPRFDESPHARATAAALGVDLEVHVLDEMAALASLPDAFLAYDEPFGDSSSLATYLLCDAVAKTHKVALGGDGGDEVFAGYKKHRAVRVRGALAAVAPLRNMLGRALAAVPSRTDRTRGWTEALRTARRVATGLAGTDAEAYTFLTQVASLATTAPLVARTADAEVFVLGAKARFESAQGTQLQKTLAGDLGGPLVDDMLVKVDRASMARHLEVRVPFLDHRLVELGVSLPERFVLPAGGKRVLRLLHERRFGRELAQRKKQGFRVPVERWLRGPMSGACERIFAKSRLDRFGVLSSAELSGGRHQAWAVRDPVILWHALALAVWCEANLGDGPAVVREMLSTGKR